MFYGTLASYQITSKLTGPTGKLKDASKFGVITNAEILGAVAECTTKTEQLHWN